MQEYTLNVHQRSLLTFTGIIILKILDAAGARGSNNRKSTHYTKQSARFSAHPTPPPSPDCHTQGATFGFAAATASVTGASETP